MNNLKEQYKKIVEEYIDVFTEKQSMDKDGWVDYVGGIYGFDTMYFFFILMRLDGI